MLDARKLRRESACYAHRAKRNVQSYCAQRGAPESNVQVTSELKVQTVLAKRALLVTTRLATRSSTRGGLHTVRKRLAGCAAVA